MEGQLVVGLFQSRGIAEDACNRLRTEGVPDGAVGLRMLREIAPVPQVVEAELAAFDADPLMWGNVRDNYVSYIHNGETVVLVRVATADEIELATNVLRMFKPVLIEVLTAQTTPEPRRATISPAE